MKINVRFYFIFFLHSTRFNPSHFSVGQLPITAFPKNRPDLEYILSINENRNNAGMDLLSNLTSKLLFSPYLKKNRENKIDLFISIFPFFRLSIERNTPLYNYKGNLKIRITLCHNFTKN
jgi:hypothetical protein